MQCNETYLTIAKKEEKNQSNKRRCDVHYYIEKYVISIIVIGLFMWVIYLVVGLV